MRVLIGPGINGLIFSRQFTDELFARTGLKYFSEICPVADWPDSFERKYSDQIVYREIIWAIEDVWTDAGSAMRSDPIVIEMVERMGKDAFDPDFRTYNYKIVEIPDDVKFYIHSNDAGEEWIAEKHRTWS